MVRSDKKTINFNIRVLIFCLIIIQSIGIRFFNGQGIFISLTIFLLLFKNLKLFEIKDVRFLFLAFFIVLSSKIINDSFKFSSLLYQMTLVICTYAFCIGYRNKNFNLQKDFFASLQIFVFHAMIGYCFCMIFPNLFVDLQGTLNKTFFNLFYVSNSSFGSIQRNTGILWEPGVFQLVANFYLFYCIKFKEKTIKILLGIIAVVSSLSTSGLMILLINVLYFIYNRWKEKKINIASLILVLSVIIVFIPIISDNTKDKVNDDNTSGLVRLRDYYVGLELIKEKPFFGHGVFDSEYLSSKNYVRTWESNLFSNEYLEISGDMGGGYTNGFLGLVAWYGIPIGFLLYYFYFKNRFIENNGVERILFNLILLITLITEPISYTSLFFIFPLSYWILDRKGYVRNNG